MHLSSRSALIERLVAFLRGGTVGFNKPELLILNSVIEALPSAEVDILGKQVRSVFLVQRPNKSTLVSAYYPKKLRVPPLPYTGYEYCLAKVSYRSKGTTKRTNVVLHDGKLMTLERNVPQGNDLIDAIKEVTLHPSGVKSVAQEIDADEHGDNA